MQTITTTLTDWDNAELIHHVEVALAPEKIEITLKEHAIYDRSVVIETQAKDGLRVMIYGLDRDEPRVFCLGFDGSITEKT